ncbi:glycosyltransferase family 2 protein [Roseomonas sp. HJA6]|uniref:Glycosyltransferase family 2 protein n=1 Tax=Roseomonas alba TaxID=2846776 RepID=A0ABS7A3F1_9PROT|nr:glycosyltransferase family A protein [Neoroseomonas alba]MBW6396775.1 glycosyltransferase family 2 protein [Neoroseomonas alba]
MTAPILFVIPTFNRAPDLPRTIRAIAAQDWPKEAIAVLVVDNSSTDNTAEVVAGLAATLPIRLDYHRKAPEGPSIARNAGLARAPEDGYCAFVDSDVELDPGWTRATVTAMEADPQLALVAGPLVFGHNRALLNCYGGALSPLGLAWDLEEGSPVSAADAPRDALWLNSSAILARTKPVRATGGFDARFFYAYEEPDLCLRLALEGWRCRLVPDAVAIHHVGSDIGRSHADFVFHHVKNRLRMGLKCFSAGTLAWWIPVATAHALLDAVLHVPKRTRLRGFVWNLRNLPDTLRARAAVQARRTVPHGQAFRLMETRWFPPTRLGGLRRRPVEGIVVGNVADDRAAR